MELHPFLPGLIGDLMPMGLDAWQKTFFFLLNIGDFARFLPLSSRMVFFHVFSFFFFFFFLPDKWKKVPVPVNQFSRCLSAAAWSGCRIVSPFCRTYFQCCPQAQWQMQMQMQATQVSRNVFSPPPPSMVAVHAPAAVVTSDVQQSVQSGQFADLMGTARSLIG